MAWGNRSGWSLPTLRNYKEASDWEAAVKPIRGDKNGTKPLGDRRKKYMNIRREGDDIVLRLYNSDLVRFKPDGDVLVSNGGYPTASTHDFIGYTIHLPIRTYDGKSWVSCFRAADMVTDLQLGEYPFPNNEFVTFRAVDRSPYWVTSHVDRPFTHQIIREKANLVRKHYASFKRYAMGIMKLRSEIHEETSWTGDVIRTEAFTITRDELDQFNLLDKRPQFVATRGAFRRGDERIAMQINEWMLSDDAGQQYKALLHMVRSVHGYYVPHNGICVEPRTVIDFMNLLILFIHKDSVLQKVYHEDGKPKRDAYGAWFK